MYLKVKRGTVAACGVQRRKWTFCRVKLPIEFPDFGRQSHIGTESVAVVPFVTIRWARRELEWMKTMLEIVGVAVTNPTCS